MVIKSFLKFLIILLFFYLLQKQKTEFKPIDSINSYCSGKIKQNKFSEIDKIEIKVNKNKIWAKNLLNLHVKLEKEKAKSPHKIGSLILELLINIKKSLNQKFIFFTKTPHNVCSILM